MTAVAESPAVFCLAATVQLKVSALLPEPPAWVAVALSP